MLRAQVEQVSRGGHEAGQLAGNQAQADDGLRDRDPFQPIAGQFEQHRRLALCGEQADLDIGMRAAFVLQPQYEALHAACLALLAPGGLYLAASCSSHVRQSAFLDTLREGARRSRRVLQILEQTGAPFDHPHVYLDMGQDAQIICPYCSTLYVYEPRFDSGDSDPKGALVSDAA